MMLLQKGSRVEWLQFAPMPIVTQGAFEIRLRDASGNYRAFFSSTPRMEFWFFMPSPKRPEKTL